MASGIKLGKMAPFEFNPRGNLWYNDENTFGRKLLSQMGWSKGKGLGKHEDGIKENIKLGKKDSRTGVGWKSDVHISVGCAEYENILSKLQQRFKKPEVKKTDNSKTLESLEKRSKTSRSRVHYQKFVRAKDFFSRSEKDMKCIFLDNPKEKEEENAKSKKDVHTYKSDLSINDYFAAKMQQKLDKMRKKSKDQNIKLESNTNEKQESDNVNETVKLEASKNSVEVKKVFKTENEFDSEPTIDKIKKKTSSSFNVSKNPTKAPVNEECGEEPNSQISSEKQLNSESLAEIIDSSKVQEKFKSKKDKKQKSLLDLVEIKINSNKERKSKKRKNAAEDTSQIKRIKLNCEELSNGYLDSSVSENNNVVQNPVEEDKPKLKKSKKKRSHKLRGLKSCIKRSASYNLNRDRRVVFNEQVSYKILDTSFESLTPINDLMAEERISGDESEEDESPSEESEQNDESSDSEGLVMNESHESSDSNDIFTKSKKRNKRTVLDSSDDLPVKKIKKESKLPVSDSNDLESTKSIKRNSELPYSKSNVNIEEDSLPECFNLPKPSSSILNMWLESQ